MPVRNSNMQEHDRVTMTCGPYKGEGGFISETRVIRASVPAVVVWLWNRDISIVTVRSHFHHHGAGGTLVRKSKTDGATTAA